MRLRLTHRVSSARGYSLAPCAALVADAVAKQSMLLCEPRTKNPVPLPTYALRRALRTLAEEGHACPSRITNLWSTCAGPVAAASSNTFVMSVLASSFRLGSRRRRSRSCTTRRPRVGARALPPCCLKEVRRGASMSALVAAARRKSCLHAVLERPQRPYPCEHCMQSSQNPSRVLPFCHWRSRVGKSHR